MARVLPTVHRPMRVPTALGGVRDHRTHHALHSPAARVLVHNIRGVCNRAIDALEAQLVPEVRLLQALHVKEGLGEHIRRLPLCVLQHHSRRLSSQLLH